MKAGHQTSARGMMRAYNLFRRKDEADLYCAVPEDIAVPSFVTEETWEFARSLKLEVLSGFDATAAEESVKANGFYLFHSTDHSAVEAEKANAQPSAPE
jgi:hypothetical protein